MQWPQNKALVSINTLSLHPLSPSQCQTFHSPSCWTCRLHLWSPSSARPESLFVLSELAHTPSLWERSNFAFHLVFHNRSAAANVARKLGPDLPIDGVMHTQLSALASLWLNWQHLRAGDWGPARQLPSPACVDGLPWPLSALVENLWRWYSWVIWQAEHLHLSAKVDFPQRPQVAPQWTSRMGQRRIPGDAGVEKADSVSVWACGGSLQRVSQVCMVGLAASRMADWLSAEEMVSPTHCPPGFYQQSHSEADLGLTCLRQRPQIHIGVKTRKSRPCN